MCGIVGFAGSTLGADQRDNVLRTMISSVLHRGPDGAGCYLEDESGVGLGHRRLAIVDLTDEGRQPMASAHGRYVISCNGEVYNYVALRTELVSRGHQFRGQSDTEVMLAAIEEWGVEAAIRRFNGMFAFALWDRMERQLWLVRDRLGKKPLYFALFSGTMVFGSELKALLAYPGLPADLDPDATCLFLRFGYIPAPYSVLRAVRKLNAGSFLKVDVAQGRVGNLKQCAYWSAEAVAAAARNGRFTGTYIEALDKLEELLRDSIAMRMVADVPLGAFLSGGVDSSTVVALMQTQSAQSVRTFTVGFRESNYSESEHAAAVAQHLGTEHTDLHLEPDAALELIPELPFTFDEPFADSSQLPTMLVARLARKHVTVALSGDGGDELFCGYNRYLWWRRLWRATHRGPRWPWRLAAAAMSGLPPAWWDGMLSPVMAVVPRAVRYRNIGDKLHKLAAALREDDPARLYSSWVTYWDRPELLVVGGHEPPSAAMAAVGIDGIDAYTEAMMLLDTTTYLPDDIMVKVDRASMAVSLEARAPLMDYRVLEFAATLPLSFKLQGGQGKRILRDVLYRYVPRELIERPKTGFSVPIDSWLRGPLKDWAESMLSENELRKSGILNAEPIRKAWADHQSGRFQYQNKLWAVLMYQSWFSRWRSSGSPPKHSVLNNAA